MPGHDDAGRHHDPFDFREPPAPLGGSGPSTPGPPSHSPFDFPDGDGRPGRRGRLRRAVRRWGAELRAAQLASPGAVVVGLAVLVVVVLVVAAVVALA